MRRFFSRLNHHRNVSRGVEVIKCGGIVIKLIAQHDDQMAANTHVDFFALAVDDLLPRQRSEQYFTSSQFFAHALRHVISRPQATHNFVGSETLLPLKLTTNPG